MLVVGGGVSGLTAAWHLRKHDVRVLEAAGAAGGRTLSGTHRGWHYAKGTEYLGKPEGALKELLTALGLRAREIPAPMDMIHDGSTFFTGDAGRRALIIKEGGAAAWQRWESAVTKAYEDYDELPEWDDDGPLVRLDAMTARQWLRSLELPAIYDRVYDVAARGLFGANLDELSALCLMPEVAFDFEDGEPEPDDPETGAYTFPRGIVEVTDALASALGGRLASNAPAVAVRRHGDGFEVDWKSGATVRTTRCEALVLATPLPVTAQLAGALLSKSQRQVIEAVPYAVYATVALFSDKPIFDRAFDLALLGGGPVTDLYDATWVERHLDPSKRDAPGGVATAYLAPSSYTDRSPLTLSDESLVAQATAAIDKVLPGAAARVVGHDVQRFPYAYPVMTPGAFGRLAGLHATLTGRLQLAGDGLCYPTFEAAVEMGALAAARVEKALE